MSKIVDWNQSTNVMTIGVCGTLFVTEGWEGRQTRQSELADIAVFVKAIEYADQLSESDIVSTLEDWLQDLAEEAEVEVTYTRGDLRKRTYSPAAHWEPSDSCEWEQSAEYGITHGWDL